MARKRRLPFDCFACGDRFATAQGVRGHRRHCRYARQQRQAEAQAGTQPGTGAAQHSSKASSREWPPSYQEGDVDRERRRPGPLGHEARLLLLDAWEGLDHLHRGALHFATAAHLMSGMNVEGEFERAKEWAEISLVLDDCLRDFDPMLALFRLDRHVLFRMFGIIRNLKERWLGQRCASHFVETEPDGIDPQIQQELLKEEAEFNRLIDQVKRLIVAAP